MGLTVRHRQAELNTSSVADIAFLLLSFFLMTTVISEDKGVSLTLPEWRDIPVEQPVNSRNIFKIQINSSDQLLVNGEKMSTIQGLRAEIKTFILNHGHNPTSSENPEKAIVSLKTDRGTSHQSFVSTLSEIQAAYYEIYAARIGMSVEQYLKLNYDVRREKLLIDEAKKGIPMNISLAEPARLAQP